MELINEPIHERLYFQSKNSRALDTIFPTDQKPSLLAICGENQALAELRRQKEQKLIQRRIHEEKRKEAMEFVIKIKKEKEKQEQKKNKIIRLRDK